MKGDHERDLEEDGSNLKHVVRKVVFQLHEDFKPNATRGIMINIAIIVHIIIGYHDNCVS